MLVSLAITVFSTSLAGRFVKVRGLLLAIPAVLVFTSLGLAAMRGVTPLWFGLATAGAAAFGLSAGALVWRRIT